MERRSKSNLRPLAVEIFKRMIAIDCTCEENSYDDCEGCREYAALDHELGQVLKLKPWQFPSLVSPDFPQMAGDIWREDALKLWRELNRAAGYVE
jgi:hypothetical protein